VSSPSHDTNGAGGVLARMFDQRAPEIVAQWVSEQAQVMGRAGIISENELRTESVTFLSLLARAASAGGIDNVESPSWGPVRDQLGSISRTRAQQGFTPSETATFVLALKRPLFTQIARELSADAARVADTTWAATELLDRLALLSMEFYLRSREEVIQRQQDEMLELSTPVVELWEGILALPMIGTLDSSRTQVVMETLLQRIVETGAEIAIIDITGVPTVDTLTAQHLLKTVTAARLMGAECIISGIRPQIAQTIVHLGVDLGDVVTKATLGDAFRVALQRSGAVIARIKPR
jgi:rsbT co-antagonist protein RsbR